jgi:hypothetical protein
MTRQEIRNMIRKKLGETTAAFWSDAEINGWIDEAGHDIAMQTNCLLTHGYITTTVVDTAEYDLEVNFPNILAVKQVYYYQNGTTWERIEQTTREELDLDEEGWKNSESSTPIKYYWSKEENVFGVWPPPDSDNVGTNYCEVYYSYDYQDLTSDSAVPGIPAYLHMAMVHFCTALGYESRGYGDKANDAEAKYNKRIAEYKILKKIEDEDDEIVMRPYRNI